MTTYEAAAIRFECADLCKYTREHTRTQHDVWCIVRSNGQSRTWPPKPNPLGSSLN